MEILKTFNQIRLYIINIWKIIPNLYSLTFMCILFWIFLLLIAFFLMYSFSQNFNGNAEILLFIILSPTFLKYISLIRLLITIILIYLITKEIINKDFRIKTTTDKNNTYRIFVLLSAICFIAIIISSVFIKM